MLKNRTSIVIAHRLSTVLRADQIVVLEGGRIADIGRHNELLARGGLYTQLYQEQFGQSDRAKKQELFGGWPPQRHPPLADPKRA